MHNQIESNVFVDSLQMIFNNWNNEKVLKENHLIRNYQKISILVSKQKYYIPELEILKVRQTKKRTNILSIYFILSTLFALLFRFALQLCK